MTNEYATDLQATHFTKIFPIWSVSTKNTKAFRVVTNCSSHSFKIQLLCSSPSSLALGLTSLTPVFTPSLYPCSPSTLHWTNLCPTRLFNASLIHCYACILLLYVNSSLSSLGLHLPLGLQAWLLLVPVPCISPQSFIQPVCSLPT